MLNPRSLDPLIELAFEEDIGIGDITTEATVPPTQTGRGTLLAKSEGIVAGLPVAERVFEKLDPTLTFRTRVKDGDAVVGEGTMAAVVGPPGRHVAADAVLQGFGMSCEGCRSVASLAFLPVVVRPVIWLSMWVVTGATP